MLAGLIRQYFFHYGFKRKRALGYITEYGSDNTDTRISYRLVDHRQPQRAGLDEHIGKYNKRNCGQRVPEKLYPPVQV